MDNKIKLLGSHSRIKRRIEINDFLSHYARHYVCHFQQSTITSTLDS